MSEPMPRAGGLAWGNRGMEMGSVSRRRAAVEGQVCEDGWGLLVVGSPSEVTRGRREGNRLRRGAGQAGGRAAGGAVVMIVRTGGLVVVGCRLVEARVLGGDDGAVSPCGWPVPVRRQDDAEDGEQCQDSQVMERSDAHHPIRQEA